MRKSHLLLASFVGAFALVASADAQNIPLSDQVEQELNEREEEISTFDQSSSSGRAVSGIEFNVGSDSSSVSANFLRSADRHKPGLFRKQYHGLKLTAPIDKSTKSGNFLTNTGFTNKFAAEFTWSGMHSRYATEEEFHREISDYAGVFVEVFDRCVTDNNGDESKCNELQENETYKALTAQLISALKPINIVDRAVWYYGVSTSAGYEKHNFRDATDLSKLNQEKVSYSISPFIGVTPNANDLYLGFGYKHSVQYKDVDEKTKCGTIDENGFQECLSASFMEPEKKTESSVFGLARYRLGQEDSNFPIAIEIKAGFDFDNDTFGVSAPIYLFADKDSNLRGGVRLAWDDDDNDLTAGIFVGSSFDLFSSN